MKSCTKPYQNPDSILGASHMLFYQDPALLGRNKGDFSLCLRQSPVFLLVRVLGVARQYSLMAFASPPP